jgi:hypothetical protein
MGVGCKEKAWQKETTFLSSFPFYRFSNSIFPLNYLYRKSLPARAGCISCSVIFFFTPKSTAYPLHENRVLLSLLAIDIG